MHVFRDGKCNRSFAAGGTKILDRRYPAQHVGKEHIKNRTDDQRPQDADRHVTLWILGLLSSSRNCVKSDVGEKNHACGSKDPHDPAEMMGYAFRSYVGGRRGNKGRVVGWTYEMPTDSDHQDHDRDF